MAIGRANRWHSAMTRHHWFTILFFLDQDYVQRIVIVGRVEAPHSWKRNLSSCETKQTYLASWLLFHSWFNSKQHSSASFGTSWRSFIVYCSNSKSICINHSLAFDELTTVFETSRDDFFWQTKCRGIRIVVNNAILNFCCAFGVVHFSFLNKIASHF